jgi:hypothetical protein
MSQMEEAHNVEAEVKPPNHRSMSPSPKAWKEGLCSARVRRGSRIRTRAVGRARSGSAARAHGQEVRGGGERKRQQWHWQLEVEEPSKATAVRGE